MKLSQSQIMHETNVHRLYLEIIFHIYNIDIYYIYARTNQLNLFFPMFLSFFNSVFFHQINKVN